MKNLGGTEVISRALAGLFVAGALRRKLLHCNLRSGRRARFMPGNRVMLADPGSCTAVQEIG